MPALDFIKPFAISTIISHYLKKFECFSSVEPNKYLEENFAKKLYFHKANLSGW
jgi:hypothetical protein